MMRFADRTALITGAASGMGLTCAREMAKEGAIVYMMDINEAGLRTEAQAIRENGGKAVECVCDLRKFEDMQSVVNRCMEEQGHIDIVVNFAGGFPPRMCDSMYPNDHTFENEPLEVIDWGIQVNFRAPMLMARLTIEQMKKQKRGVIINIGSVSGETGGGTDYAAEKSGVSYGLTKAIAHIGAPYGVRCCAVTPGPVLTRPNMASRPCPLGRVAQPIEVVNLVMYLCSDEASFITGTNHIIDGGRLLMNIV